MSLPPVKLNVYQFPQANLAILVQTASQIDWSSLLLPFFVKVAVLKLFVAWPTKVNLEVDMII